MIKNGPVNQASGTCGPGQTVRVACSGTFVYFTAMSCPMFVKPTGGNWVLCYPGTGPEVEGGFNGIQIYNPTANAGTFLLVYGSTPFIDHRAVRDISVSQIVNSISIDGTSPYGVAIPNLAGQAFTDGNGATWLALQRVSLTMSIFTGAPSPTTPLINLYDNAGQAGAPIFQILKGQNYTIEGTGNFGVDVSCANGYFAVFELYEAVAPNAAAYQPPN